MKKFILIALGLAFFTSANAQQMVTTTIDSVSETTVTASFVKNSNCNSFSYMIGSEGELDGWAQLMQTSVLDLIELWGATSNENTSFTWTDLAPGTQYYIYVNAHTTTDTVTYTTPVSTLSIGGNGTSIINIEVSEITETQARVICTANDETLLFKDMLITVDYYNQIGADSALALVKDDFYVHYVIDDWVWLSLQPQTNYYVLAIGQNADSVWGELSMMAFTTTSDGVDELLNSNTSLYPNPVVNNLFVNFNKPTSSNTIIQLFSVNGQLINSFNVPSNTINYSIDASNLVGGTYLLKLENDEQSSVLSFVKW